MEISKEQLEDIVRQVKGDAKLDADSLMAQLTADKEAEAAADITAKLRILNGAIADMQSGIDFGHKKATEQIALLTEDGIRLAGIINNGVNQFENMKATLLREKAKLTGE